MGVGQCTGCKEYYNPIKMSDYEFDLSQSSTFKNFKNPFFPCNMNSNILSTENYIVNINEEEEEEKKNEEFNRLKNKILEQERQNRKNIKNNEDEDVNHEINNYINNNDIINSISNENNMSFQREKEINTKINNTLENMCNLGIITKKEIHEEKLKNPEKFIDTSEALKLEKTDNSLFALGLLSKKLEDLGIETAIEKETNDDEEDAAATCLQFIASGLADKKKYDLHFEFGEERNEQLLNDENEFENFKVNLKKKLSKDYHIPEDKIIVTFPQKGSFHVQVIFQSSEFNDLDLDDFKQKFQNDDEFKELSNLKDIHSDIIMGACKLTRNHLDERGNRVEGWGVGEERGGLPYNPPLGWIGIGLKVLDKYEDNIWLGSSNEPGEWCVAYHGVGRYKSSDEVKGITGKIYKGALKPGINQVHNNCENLNKPGTKVGDGVYCTPNIDTACYYSGVSEINGKNYQTVLMVRVKRDAIRRCADSGDYWVVNGTTDEIRPYRILYKCD